MDEGRWNPQRAGELRAAREHRPARRMNLHHQDVGFAPDNLVAPDDIWGPLAASYGEVDWRFNGNNIETPLAGADDFAFKVKEEVFTLRFTGLVSEEDPSLAAMGVSVCDSDGNVVIKIQKRALPVEKEVLDAMALFEGLNAALSFGITRLRVFIHAVPLYNYMTGRWPVRQHGHDLESITHAKLLRKNFKECNIYVLPQSQSQDMITLAKDVIDSHIKKDKRKAVNQQSNKITCTICFEEYACSSFFTIDSCNHQFCFSCMRQHVEVQLLHGVLPGCLHEHCKNKLDVESCRKFLPPKLSEIMADRVFEASIPEGERVYCPYPRCSALMSIRNTIHVNPGSSPSQASISSSSGARRCAECNNLFCINCKVPWHEGLSCIDFQKFHAPITCSDDEKLKALARSRSWRQCTNCNQMIELLEGCEHMICRCGAQFCYICGSPWTRDRPPCSCFIRPYQNNVPV